MSASIETRRGFETLSGRQKAAIFLVAIGKNAASKVMKEMATADVESVTRQIAEMERVPHDVVERVLEELYENTIGTHGQAGGIEYARQLLTASFGAESGEALFGRILKAMESESPRALKQLDARALLTFLHDEHPQTIALVLVHVSPQKAAVVLSGISPEMRGDVARRMGRIGPTSLDALLKIEEQLQEHGMAIHRSKRGGAQALADVLHQVDRTNEEMILESLEDDDPELAERVRDLLFVFEDLVNRDDRVIQNLLKEVETRELALALKGASLPIQSKIFENMPNRAKEVILEEMSFMGPVRSTDIEGAQRTILMTLRRLEEEAGPSTASVGDS